MTFAPACRARTPARGEGAGEQPAAVDGHRPDAAVLHVGGGVELPGEGPRVTAVVAVDLTQRQGAGVELAVVDGHGHHLQLLAEAAHTGPGILAVVAEDLALGPGADVQLPVVGGERVDLGDALLAAGVHPVAAAVVAEHAARLPAFVARSVEVAVEDPERHHAAARGAAVLPAVAAPVAEDALAVERDGVQLAPVNGHARARVGALQAADAHPLAAARVAVHGAAGGPVLRLRQRRAAGPVARRAGVELALEDAQGSDGVGGVRAPARLPAGRAVVAVDASGLVGAGLERAGVQVAVEDAQGVDAEVVAGAPAVDPCALAAGIDAEVEVAVVGLSGGHAGVVEEAELESGPGCGVVAADDVARDVVENRLGMDLDGKREVAGAQVQAGRGGYEDVGAAAVEHGAVRRQVHPRGSCRGGRFRSDRGSRRRASSARAVLCRCPSGSLSRHHRSLGAGRQNVAAAAAGGLDYHTKPT